MTIVEKLEDWGPMTSLMIIAAIIVMGIGGAVVVFNPDALTFERYLDNLKAFAIAVAGLAGARGILGAGKTIASANVDAAAMNSSPHPLPPDAVHGIPADDELGLVMDEELPSDEEELVAPGDLPSDDEEFGALDDGFDEEMGFDGYEPTGVVPDAPPDGDPR